MSTEPSPTIHRRDTRWMIAAVVLLAMLVVGAVAALLLYGPQPSDVIEKGSRFIGESAAWWSADGSRAVIRAYDATGTPVTVVVELEEGTVGAVREFPGYYPLAVEPYGPTVWLTPGTAEDIRAGRTDACGASGIGPWDQPPARLVALSLDTPDATPTDAVPAKWDPWPGPGEWVMYPEIDVLRGAWPSRLLFNTKASHGEGHGTALPEDFGTFRPLGWSPSGSYVALEEMASAEDCAGGKVPDRRVVIVDAGTGEVTATGTLSANTSSGPAWASDRDLVVWIDVSANGMPSIVAMDVQGTLRDASSAFGASLPAQIAQSYTIDILGTGPSGLLLAADDNGGRRIWSVSASGIVDEGVLAYDYTATAWNAGGGLLAMKSAYSGDSSNVRDEAYLLDIHGADTRLLWSGQMHPESLTTR